MIEKIRKEFERGNYNQTLQYATDLMQNNYILGQIWRIKCLELINFTYDPFPLIYELENELLSQKKRNSIEFVELQQIKHYRSLDWRLKKDYLKEIEMRDEWVSITKEIFNTQEFQRETSEYDKLSTKFFLAFHGARLMGDDNDNPLIKNLGILLNELNMKNSSEYEYLKFMTLRNLSTEYWFTGQVEEALIFVKQALTIIRQFGNKRRLIQTLCLIGVCYAEIGEFLESRQYFEEGIAMSIDLNVFIEVYNMVNILQYYAFYLFELTLNADLANHYLSNAQKILNNSKSKNNEVLSAGLALIQAEIYRTKFNISLFKKNDSDALKYLNFLKQMAEQIDDKNINDYYKFCKAVYHFNKGRIEDKFKSMNLLKEILIEKQINNEITYPAILLLISIQLTDYAETEDREILEEINNQVEKFSGKSNLILQLKLNILKSKLLMVEGKIMEAKNLLEETLLVVKEKKLLTLESAITNEIEKIQKEKSRWSIFEDEGSSQKQIRISELKSYINDVVKVYGEIENLKEV